MITLGSVLLAGLAVEAIGRRTRLPRVTLLLVFGFAVGPHALDLFPVDTDYWFGLVTDLALVMIGFLLGERFTLPQLRRHGRDVLWVSVATVVVTVAVVAGGLWLIGAPLSLALLLGTVAAATDPAATYDVVQESRAGGPFTDTLLGVVAVDDAWGLLVFSLALAATAVIDGGGALAPALLDGAREIGGALFLGMALGVPAAYLTHRLAPGEPTVLEALGVVLLCGGLALWLHVSFILAAMVLGATTANLAHRHRRRPFHAIEGIERPFLVVFFVLAGASLNPEPLVAVGWLGAGYVAFRVAGRILGGWLGGRMAGADIAVSRWSGLALLPQAGVALGVALLAAERRPELAETLLSLVIAATVIFEMLGPLCTRYALTRAGEVDGASRGDGTRRGRVSGAR